jgi:hypothetical protein
MTHAAQEQSNKVPRTILDCNPGFRMSAWERWKRSQITDFWIVNKSDLLRGKKGREAI